MNPSPPPQKNVSLSPLPGHARIWPKPHLASFGVLMFWPNYLFLVVVVPGGSSLVPVGACCSSLVPVGACCCCCLLLLVVACSLLVPCWCLLLPVGACCSSLVPVGACCCCCCCLLFLVVARWCLLVPVVFKILGLSPGPPSAGPPQNFALFFLSPAGNFFLSSLSRGSSR